MTHIKSITFILTVFAVSFIVSCEKEKGEQIDATSTSTSSKSHNNGQDCMNCHKRGSSGDGWFSVAGSVYNSTQTVPYITAKVQLRTAAAGSGNLVKEIQVDMNGNFYTTEPVNFGTGLHVSVVGGTITKYMSEKITTGDCNKCHDASKRIWTD